MSLGVDGRFLHIQLHILSILHSYCIFSVPVPSVKIDILNNQTVGQSLTLECSINTVKGITSRVDIVWSSNGMELKRIYQINASFSSNHSELLKDTYNISLLSTNDDARVFYCEVVIFITPLVMASDYVSLDVFGK